MTTKKIMLTQKIALFLVFMSLIVSLSMGDSLPNAPQTIDLTPDSEDDLAIDFTLNQTSIGRHNGVLAEINFTNTGEDPFSDIKVNFTLDGEYTEFSSTYSSYQEVSLLVPTQNATVNVEVILNLTQIESEAAADVVLVFDASGSMSAEINSVKAEFTNVVNRLADSIESLQIGMIVYGWSKYSQYPASSVNNYVELTTSHNDVLDLIDELYADGGIEPWGDAFSVINGWGWREDVAKLAIIVGDEDCDPGNLVGVGSTDDWYNGTQLVNVITSLKEKGVQINSVITDVIGHVENQFQWIADYTGGVCVYLEDIQSGTDPIDLPELIEGWTLKLVREFFVNLNVNISWTENTIGGPVYYSTVLTKEILVDLAPPSITVSTIINNVEDLEYELEIYATIKDISGIVQANMYYTYDSLTGPFEPTWHFMILADSTGSTYYTTLDNLEEGDKVSFYIEAMDNLSNVGLTVIYNLTITLNPNTLGSITEFVFTADNTTKTLSFNFTDPFSYLGFNNDPNIGYLWIDSNQNLIVEIDAGDSIVTSLYTDSTNKIIKISKSTTDIVFASIQGNTSSSSIKMKWTSMNEISDFTYFENNKPIITETRRTILFHADLTTTAGSGFFTLIPYDTELVATVTIFESDWTLVDTIGAYENIELTNGEYYFWVEQVVRTGAFALYYGPDEITNGDPYYREYTGSNGSIPYGAIITSFVMIGVFVALRKRRKSTKEAK